MNDITPYVKRVFTEVVQDQGSWMSACRNSYIFACLFFFSEEKNVFSAVLFLQSLEKFTEEMEETFFILKHGEI